ncbi:hypothetical protein HPB51_015456 [Rhipicephalus microplus]|uniref:Uncharacterized protein n=1 Tax=Rhipicephalus microplus TaxID=6941 RepID=A0A9J6EAI2_RHIMP|nr:hypothetical protein HPB51_015456 [Rhipicephalus microplus]
MVRVRVRRAHSLGGLDDVAASTPMCVCNKVANNSHVIHRHVSLPSVGLHNLVYKKSPEIAKELGDNVRKLIVIIGELAISLEKVSDVPPTDWMGIGDTVVAKTEKLNLAEIEPFWSYIPKVKDFQSIKLLGAGGFGYVLPSLHFSLLQKV